ncbi:hypothetical protein PLIIFM63780_008018 [Purpureocillium lilacinum]|nr:hypothetical protein PLIIFM63780_008018 [Purpureocillium lilacinum]
MHFNYKLFKGVSVQLHDIEGHREIAAKLASAPSIKNVWPIEIHRRPNITGNGKPLNLKDMDFGGEADGDRLRRDVMNETDTWPPHVMTQVDKLRAKGITGKGIKLAVIDSGVDWKHPALGGCFGEGCRISFGYDLVGDNYDGYNMPEPDPDPRSTCNGHGTHITGIVAAKDEALHFTGAAPDVTLGVYRTEGCKNGDTANDVLIAAFNMAFEAGADIITCSLADNHGWSETPWSVVVSRIVEHGVMCTLAAANYGSQGALYATSAADGKGVTAVSSFESDKYVHLGYASKVYVDGGQEKVFVSWPASKHNWTPISKAPMPVYPLSLEINLEDACTPLPDSTPDLSNHVILVSSEDNAQCGFEDKARNLAAKGARYILFYFTWADFPLYTYEIGDANVTAAAQIPFRTGKRWIDAIKAGHNVAVLMQYPRKKTRYLGYEERTEQGGYLSTFTSWGPTWEMDAKPVVGAPGGAIFSTWTDGEYYNTQGTSMSTPLTGAIMALILQVRGPTTPRSLNNLVSSTAKPQIWFDGTNAYPGVLAPVPQQGAGLIQAYDAAYATTLLDPSSLSFNDTDHFADHLNFIITNKGHSAVTYSITHAPALTAYALDKNSIWATPFPPEVSQDYATLVFSDIQVNLKPGSRKVISVSARPPSGIDDKRLPIWSGYIVINGTDGTALSLPYQGLSGSLQTSTTLGPEYGWMSWSNETMESYSDPDPTRAPANYTYKLPRPGTTTRDLLPMLTFRLALGSQLVRADLVPLTTCAPKNATRDPLGGNYKTLGQHPLFPMRFAPRGLQTIVWDGSLDSGEYAPPGRYKFVFRALRVYGDASKLQDYCAAESQPFNIAYKH